MDIPLPPAIGKPAIRALTAAGITHLQQIAALSDAELLALHGVGPKAVRILREALVEKQARDSGNGHYTVFRKGVSAPVKRRHTYPSALALSDADGQHGSNQRSYMAFKPEGYNSVSPYLTVNGAQRSIDFLVHVFGAQPLRMIPGQHGKLGHGEVRIDDTVLMFTDAVEGWPATPSHVHIYVADVDAIFARAVEAGATVVKEPVQAGDVDKRGGFMDAGGTTWWVSTQME